MSTAFVDRIDITQTILEKVKNREKTQVFLLYAETGVGKTALARKLLYLIKQREPHLLIIDMPMNPVNQSSNTNQNDYTLAIFRTLYTLFSKNSRDSKRITSEQYNKFNFNKYIASNKSPRTRKHILEFIDENFIQTKKMVGDILKDTVDILFQRIFKIGIFDEDSIIEELEKSVLVVKDYIEFIFKKAPLVIHIDNIQNIDDSSQQHLLEWIECSQRNHSILILEYTLTNQGSKRLAHFYDYIKLSTAEVTQISLKKLTDDHVVEIALSNFPEKKEDESYINSIRSHYIGKSNGNIFELINFLLIHSQNTQNEKDNALQQNLIALDKNEKFIISILILHGGKMNANTLRAIVNRSNLLFNEEELKELVDQIAFIEKKGDEYYLQHASIIDAWEGCSSLCKDIAYFTAYKYCSEYYETLLRRGIFFTITRSKCIAILLDLFSKFDCQKLVCYIDELEEISATTLSADEIWKKSAAIFNVIKDRPIEYEDEIFQIIEICLQCEMYEKAQYCLENVTFKLEGSRSRDILYRCLISHLRERHEETLEIIERNLSCFGNGIDKYLYLFKIVALRSLNHSLELSEWISFLRNECPFTDAYTHGCFLRLAETYETKNNAIPLVKQSIEEFENMGYYMQAAKARISLSYLLSVTGNISEAIMESKKAEEILNSTLRNRIIFSVNSAALLLLSNRISEKVWDSLDEVETFTYTTFNKIAILINKIVYCIETDNRDNGILCAKKLIAELQDETDRHIIAIAAYDLYLFYSLIEDDNSADFYYDIAYQNREHCSTLLARIEGNSSLDFSFLLSKPWHVCFLGYWDIDIKPL